MEYRWYAREAKLIEQINRGSQDADLLTFWNLTQTGYVYRYLGTTVFVDPVLADIMSPEGVSRRAIRAPFAPEDPVAIDYLCCTHDHIDHLHPETLIRVAAAHPETTFIVPMPSREKVIEMGIDGSRIIGAVQGEPLQLTEDITVLPIAVPHDVYDADEQGNERALSYYITFGHIHIYHAGDSVACERLIRDVREAGPVDIAFLPINGRDYWRESKNIIGNMNPLDAVKFSASIACDLTVPTHYDMMLGNQEDPLIFAHYMMMHRPLGRYHILKPGESYLYRKP